MLILILSWTLGGVCRELIGTGEFISGFIASSNVPLQLLPFVVFVIAALMSFSMGTSWGTFGLLIPIVTMICSATAGAELLIPTLGATLAGSVYGDHCSPISDTTILASTGAQCEHIRHVETQIPYATLTAVICAVGYLIIGFTNTPWIGLAVSAVLLIGAMLILHKFAKPKKA
jgi:Na+/H+ antiporter NhaC